MRLVHFSDLHLGYRQYQRQTPLGINQREADVAGTFTRVIDRTIELAPELVVVGGDVFHNVRPTNQAIMHAYRQFARLTRALPNTPVVVVAGNHDLPRAAETGCILGLFREIGVHVVDRGAERLAFPELDLAVLAVPDLLGMQRPALVPDAQYRNNVLLLHGEVQGMLPEHLANTDRASVEIPREELGAQRWSYVALGHYHVHREIAPNAYYSGSIDYTSANTWGELFEQREARVPGKGIVEHDLATGAHRFHPIAPSRPLIDLPQVIATGLNASDVDARIRETVEGCDGGIEDRIVRLVVRDLPRHVARELDHKVIREYKRTALHFHLDMRRPEPRRGEVGQGAPTRRPTLADVVREKLMARNIEHDLDRQALVDLGLMYLRDADGATTAPAAALEP